MNDAKPISIAPYLDVVYRHRVMAICVLLLGLGTTLCLLVMLPNIYQSSAVIVIEPAQVSADYVEADGQSARPQNVNVADQLEALEHQAFSQARLEELIRKFGLYNVNAHPGQVLDLKVKNMERHIDLIVPQNAILYESAHSQTDTPSVLKLSFEYSDAKTAQLVTQELANSYIDEGYNERIQRAKDATGFLAAQVARANSELADKSKQLHDVERRYEGSLPEELEPNLAELGRLQNQLSLINQQIATQRMNPMAAGQTVASTPEQELQALELKLAALHAEYSDEYPDVIQVKEQIADLKQQIRQSDAEGAETAPAKVAAHHGDGDEAAAGHGGLERQADMLSAQIGALNARIAATPLHGQELDALKRDYDASETEYHNLLKKQLSAQLRETLEERHQDERLRLLEAANMPKAPSRPNRIATVILGVIFSMAAAVGLPFAVYFTDTSFKEPAELQSEYGISVVAMIPKIEMPAARRMAALRAVCASSVGMLVIAAAIWTYANLVF
jgi:polysaccharide biosynthesis transport protein